MNQGAGKMFFKNKKIIFSMIAILVVLVTLVSLFFTGSVSNITKVARQGKGISSGEMQISANAKKKIEVALTKHDSAFDMFDFKEDVYAELENLGISRKQVKFHDIDTEVMSTNDNSTKALFNAFEQDGDDGQWSYNQTTGEIVNNQSTDNFTGFYFPGNYDAQDIVFTFDNTTIDSGDDAMGALIKCTKNADGTMTSYIFMLDAHDDDGGIYNGYLNGLLKVDQGPFGYESIQEILYQIPDVVWTRDVWSNYRIEAKGNRITIYQDDIPVVDVIDNTENAIYSGSCGFFSWFQPQAKFKNVTIESKAYQTDAEALSNINWDSNSLKLIVSADSSRNNINNQQSISTMTNKNIYYEGIGNDTNRNTIEQIIQQNNSKGIYVDEEDYNNVVETTAQYIKTLIGDYETSSEYIVLGDNIEFNITPTSAKNNTANAEYPQGKWKIVHDYQYFENNNGQYENSGAYINNFPEEFTKVGKYELFYEDLNISPQYIYVHRRPTAEITMEKNGDRLTLSSENSIDLDKQSENRGISEVEWSYKKSTDSNWTTTSELSYIDLEDNVTYNIRLRVKDYQNTWSEYDTEEVINVVEIPPVADFELARNEVMKHETLEITDNSYDPLGGEITQRTWTITKNGEQVYSGEERPTNFMNYGIGQYEIGLVVKNAQNLESEKCTKSITVTEDPTAPVISVNKTSGETMNAKQEVELEFFDEGGSGFKNYQYAILDRNDADEEEIQWTEGNESNIIEITRYGDNYLYVRAYDNAGNKSIETFGKYYIENKKIRLEIEKVDKENENIRLANARIKVENTTVKTNKAGRVKSSILAQAGGVKTTEIEETSAPIGYSSIGTQNIQVEYDQNGDVINATSESENIEVLETEKERISIRIKDEKIDIEDGYKIKIEVRDQVREDIKVQGAKYQIEIDAESGEQIVVEEITNADGIIEIGRLATIGETKIKITELSSGEGYKTDESVKYLTITRSETGEIQTVENKTSKSLEGSIDGTEEVKIILGNEKKEEVNRVVVEVQEGVSTKLGGIGFKIKNTIDNIELQGKTNENGQVVFSDIKSPIEGEGDIIYKIIPDANRYGIEEITMVIRYNQDGIISEIEEITSKAKSVSIGKEEDKDKVYYNGKVLIDTEKEETVEVEKIKIIKVDADNEDERLEGVYFKIRQEVGEEVKTQTQVTDHDGKIEVKLINADEIKVTIQEIKTISGYKLNNETEEIWLVRNNETGKIGVDEIRTQEGLDIYRDNKGIITIKEKNKRKISQGSGTQVEKKANISFFITEKDTEGRLLGNKKFELMETTTGRNYVLETNGSGQATIEEFDIEEEGTYEFYITDKETIPGYELNEVPIKLVISYEEYQGEMKTTQIMVPRGYKYIEEKRCDEYETKDTYQLDVYMTIINATLKNVTGVGCESEISLTKIGNAGDRLNDAVYEMTVEYENGKSVSTTDTIDVLNEVMNSIFIPNGKQVRISLKEKEAPVGYKINESEKSIVLTSTNSVLGIVSQDLDRRASVVDGYKLNIVLQDEAEEMGGELIPEVHVEPEKTYKINVLNSNNYNDRITMEGSVFNVKITKDEKTVYNANKGINRWGDNTAKFTQIGIEGRQTITIEQIVAPLHHVINNTVYTVEIDRNADKEKIQLISKSDEHMLVEIDNDSKTITIEVKNEASEILMAINKVDEEDHDIGLGNVKFLVQKYRDTSTAGLNTYKYIETGEKGTGCETVSSFMTSGTALYEIVEVKEPEGYYKIGSIGVNITTDSEGNITNASTVENSSLFEKGKCIVEKIEGKYIELTVLNTRKPEPTYSVIINNKNVDDELQKVSGSEFHVEINQEQGATISRNIVTGGNGIAQIGGLTGKGQIEVKIKQVRAGSNYKKDTVEKTIQLERNVEQIVTNEGNIFEKNIELKSKNPEDVSVMVINERQEIIIDVLNERLFGIEIRKEALEDLGRYIPDAKFGIYEGEERLGQIMTDSYGRGYLSLGEAPENEVRTYRVVEEEEPDGYENIGYGDITVSFGEGGIIENVTAEAEYMTAYNRGTSLITVEVKEPYEQEIVEDPDNPGQVRAETYFNLRIVKEDMDNPKLNIDKVVFDIYAEAEDGRKVRTIKTTNSAGEIEVKRIPGDKVNIRIKEMESATGYVLDNEERTIVIQKQDNNGKDIIKLVKEESSQDIDIQVDEELRIVEVRLKNTISENNMGIAIVKEDAEDREIRLQGATYEILDVEEDRRYDLTTANKGLGNLILDMKEEGTYQFEIREKTAPVGYKLNEGKIKLEVEIAKNEVGKEYISVARLIDTDDTKNRITKITNNYIEIHTKDEAEEFEGGEYNIRVVKVDRDDLSIPLEGAELEIVVTNSEGQAGIVKYGVSDENGEILVNNIKGAGNININIREIVAPEGRKFDARTKVVSLTRDIETKRIRLIEANNVDIQINNKEQTVTVYVRNEMVDYNYTLVVEKAEYGNDDIKLENVKMKILLPGTSEPKEYTTDENGRIIIKNITMPAEGEYTYTISEIESQEGYELLNEDVVVKLKFEEVMVEEEIEIDGVVTTVENMKEQITRGEVVQGDKVQVAEILPKYARIVVYNTRNGEPLPEKDEEISIKSSTYLIGNGINFIEDWTPGDETAYTEGDLYIKGIRPQVGPDTFVKRKPANAGTYLPEFISNLDTNAEITVYKPIFDDDGNEVLLEENKVNNDELIATGMRVVFEKGDKQVILTAIVRGDLHYGSNILGDGKLDGVDVAKARKLNARRVKTDLTEDERQALDYYVNTDQLWSANKMAMVSTYASRVLKPMRESE